MISIQSWEQVAQERYQRVTGRFAKETSSPGNVRAKIGRFLPGMFAQLSKVDLNVF